MTQDRLLPGLQTWHGCVLQLCSSVLGPEQPAPPLAGDGQPQERERLWVPPPQETEQLLQPLQPHQPPSTGQPWVLQLWELAPEQAAPPQAGAGLVQVRVRFWVFVPPPQSLEQLVTSLQSLQGLQPPSTLQQPQSAVHEEQVSPKSQAPLGQQAPQSPEQLEQFSPNWD